MTTIPPPTPSSATAEAGTDCAGLGGGSMQRLVRRRGRHIEIYDQRFYGWQFFPIEEVFCIETDNSGKASIINLKSGHRFSVMNEHAVAVRDIILRQDAQCLSRLLRWTRGLFAESHQ